MQLPPAGHWSDRRRPSFVVDPRPLPDPADAATLVLSRYLAAFGPASRRDAAAWAGVAQRDFAEAWERLETVEYRDEHGTALSTSPAQPLPPASTPLPPRLLAHWDQPLLAHADRERIIPTAVQPLKLTLSGDPTVTVDGRVAASWARRARGRRRSASPSRRTSRSAAPRAPRSARRPSAPPASASPTRRPLRGGGARLKAPGTKSRPRGGLFHQYRQDRPRT